MKRPHILVVSAGASREYREYLLRSLSRNFVLSLLDHRDVDWTLPFVEERLPFDVLDERAASEVTRLNERQPIDGILCYDELRIVHAARLAEMLSLPTTSSDALVACRDKRRTRELLGKAGVSQPASFAVSTLEDALQMADFIGYPVVIKPRGLMASEGVARIDSPDELRRRYDFTSKLLTDTGNDYNYSSILVEEYVVGEEISIDGAIFGSTYTPLFVGRKTLGFAPHFEEVSHAVDANDPLLEDSKFCELLRSIHAALKITDGMTHVEIRITASGPRVIEVNGRIGGDLIPRVGWYATGIDIAAVAGDIAIGQQPKLARSKESSARIRFFYPEGPTVVEKVFLPPTDGIVESAVLVDPGDYVDVPPAQFVVGRLAYAIAVGAETDLLDSDLLRFGDGIHLSRIDH